MDSIYTILQKLAEHQVEYVVIGGMAGVLHGAHVVTEDIDICIDFSRENLSRLLAALSTLSPRHRMSPRRPPLTESVEQLTQFKNLDLITNAGQLDILGEVPNLGLYSAVRFKTISAQIHGLTCQILDIDTLIGIKEALGRPQDKLVVRALKAIRERIQNQHDRSN